MIDEAFTQKFLGVITVVSMTGVVIEYFYAKSKNKNWYNKLDFFANLNLTSGQLFWQLITGPFIFTTYYLIWKNFNFLDFKNLVANPFVYWPIIYLIAEFLQYWNHRLSHTIKILIAGHITHHSSEYFNLSTALRINWVYRAYAWFFYIPLALMGVPVMDFFIIQLIMNVYNFFCHGRYNINFGLLKYILLTPQYHLIHHCANDKYFNKNFGGSLIIFDRIFGTFVEPDQKVKFEFGLKDNIRSVDPIVINFHYFKEIFEEAKKKNRNFFQEAFSTASFSKRTNYKKENFDKNINNKFILIFILVVIVGFVIGKNKEDLLLWHKILIILLSSCLLKLNAKFITKNE